MKSLQSIWGECKLKMTSGFSLSLLGRDAVDAFLPTQPLTVGVCPGGSNLPGCAQPRPALCGPVDCSPPGRSVHGVSRQEHWSRLPFPSPGDLPDPRIGPESPVSPAL